MNSAPPSLESPDDPEALAIDDRTAELLQLREVVEYFAGFARCGLGSNSIRHRHALVLDEAEFEAEFDRVREVWRLFGDRLQPPIEGLFDPTQELERLAMIGSVLSAGELQRMARLADLAGPALGFSRSQHERAPDLARRCAGLVATPEVVATVRRVIDDDDRVRDSASGKLAHLRGELRAWGDRIQKEVARLLRHHGNAGHLSDTYFTVRDGRYCLPVMSSRRRSVPGIVHGNSSSGETVFVEPLEVVELANELATLQAAEEEEVRRILAATTDAIRPFAPDLVANTAIYAAIDDLGGRARAGWETGLALPRLKRQPPVAWSEEEARKFGLRPAPRGQRGQPEPVAPRANGALQLARAHHPILKLGLAESKSSIPIDVSLRAGDRALVLSGPNAGGKTTALKMLGLLCYLAQAGFPVPCGPDSTLPIVEHLGAAIGDLQDILAGDSTFSAHLKRLRDLLNEAGPGSLLLLDEIAAGTDPSEGAPLAIAYLEALVKRGALVVCTSHLGPVKEWANEHAAVRNASFHLHPDTHAPTFSLAMDIPGTSEALIVAERVGMDRSVVDRARAIIPEERRRALHLLSTLQEKTRLADERALRLHEQEERAARKENEVAARETALRAERQGYRDRLLQEKLRDLRAIRAEVERQVAALPPREGLRAARVATDAAIARGERDLERNQREATPASEGAAGAPAMPKPGQRVYVQSLGTEADVLRVDAGRGLVCLLVRGVQLEIGLGQLQGNLLPSGLGESELPDFRLDALVRPAPTAQPPKPEPTKPTPAKNEPAKPAATAPARDPLLALLDSVIQRDAGRGLFRNSAHAQSQEIERQWRDPAGAEEPVEEDVPEAEAEPAAAVAPDKRRKKKEFGEEEFFRTLIPEQAPRPRAKPPALKASFGEHTGDGSGFVPRGGVTVRKASASPELTLDMHGMRVEEALKAVDDHIDRALVNDYPYVRLMHGFGTGALRRSIREHLRHHPAVKRVTLAPPNDGGGGVSIVEFK